MGQPETPAGPIAEPAGYADPQGVTSSDDADPIRVLVVDDEPHLVWVLRLNLEASGYRSFGAEDGRQGLLAIREQRPHVVLLDIMMPEVDGWTVLEEIQRLPSEDRPCVVVVSARTGQQERERAEALGATAYVAKPFDLDELLTLVAQVAPTGLPEARLA